MKIACISDTHGRQGWSIPKCDVFIHAWDITAGGSRTETKKFAERRPLFESGGKAPSKVPDPKDFAAAIR